VGEFLPDKERELERRLEEIKEEEESLSKLHKDLVASFKNANRSHALDWDEFQAQEVRNNMDIRLSILVG
jgi:hypothetical protein